MGILDETANQESTSGAAPARALARDPGIITALELGTVVPAPGLRFQLTESEQRLLSPTWLEPHAKNISFSPHTAVMSGTRAQGADHEDLQHLLRRFSSRARDLLIELYPRYRESLQIGLTSFRPAEVEDHESSWRKDDTRLHLEACPSRPLQGRRILRFLLNVGNRPRHWQTGEPFETVARNFLPRLGDPRPGSLWLLEHLHVTHGRRTLYDHFMLGLHDAMKSDPGYQAQAKRTGFEFPPGASWICYTDLVSHAAISGQFALEQTFYLPVSAMQDSARSPLRILERLLGRPLL
jgi:hypothetical protein